MFHHILKACAIAAMLCIFIVAGSQTAFSFIEEAPSKLSFKPSDDALADVKSTLTKAKANNKLVMVIMGANWCHDSRSFLKKLETPEMQALVASTYEYVIVDVGYLEHGSQIMQHFGKPVIYGTPTVLVIDPATNKLLNENNLHRWRDSDSIPLEDTVSYFSNLPKNPEVDVVTQTQLIKLYQEIDAFEKAQATRVYSAFNIIGPMISLKKSDRPQNFYTYWNQLRDFRYQITVDLKTLKADAKKRVEAGEKNISLSYPTYEPFDWEKEGFTLESSR